MRTPPKSGHAMGHIERAADNATPFPGLRLPCPAAVLGRHLPGRVIRRRGDDCDAVPTSRKPGGHLAGIFADASELRCEIEADDQKVHISVVQYRKLQYAFSRDNKIRKLISRILRSSHIDHRSMYSRS